MQKVKPNIPSSLSQLLLFFFSVSTHSSFSYPHNCPSPLVSLSFRPDKDMQLTSWPFSFFTTCLAFMPPALLTALHRTYKKTHKASFHFYLNSILQESNQTLTLTFWAIIQFQANQHIFRWLSFLDIQLLVFNSQDCPLDFSLISSLSLSVIFAGVIFDSISVIPAYEH